MKKTGNKQGRNSKASKKQLHEDALKQSLQKTSSKAYITQFADNIQQLQMSESRLRLVAENAPDIIIELDRQGHIQYISRVLPGFDINDVLGKDFCNWVPPEIQSLARGTLEDVFLTGKQQGYEAQGYGDYGKLRWYMVQISPNIVDGRIASAVFMARDVTDRKQTEDALRNSESQLKVLFDNSPNAIAFSKKGIHVMVNNKYLEMFGCAKDEVIGKPILQFVSPSCQDQIRALILKRDQGENQSYSYITKGSRKNGEEFDLEVESSVCSLDGTTYSIAHLRDITDRNQIAAALQDSEERFRCAFVEAPFPIIIYVEDGEIIALSKQFTELTGYDLKDVPTIPKLTDKLFGHRHQEANEYISALFDKTYRSPGAELPVAAKDGKTMIWYFTSSPLGAQRDGRKLAVAIADDITERKRLEEERIERMSSERAMDQVLMDIHDGIGGITTNINLLAEVAMKASRQEDIEKALKTISDLAREGIEETRSLMYSLDREDLNWHSLAIELRSQGKKLLEPHEIEFTLTTDIKEDLQNPSRHVCLNLFRIYRETLTNVVKHANATKVTTTLRVDKEHLVLKIQDNGQGYKDSALIDSGRGVNNMMTRAAHMQGKVIFTEEGGTCVTIEFPLSLKPSIG